MELFHFLLLRSGFTLCKARERKQKIDVRGKQYMSNDNMDVEAIFGENVFNDATMQERLPKKTYQKLKETIRSGRDLDSTTADVVAHR